MRAPPRPAALVTGASSGIGRAVSIELARRGHDLWLCARRVGRLEAAAEEVRAAGGAATVVPLDVTDTAATRRAVEEADEASGGLALVVANAGVAEFDLDPHSYEALEFVTRVNLLGAVATLAPALERMRARGCGTLVGVSSLAGTRGMPGAPGYCATKSALSTWLESLQIDLAGTGVRVVDVQPGFVVSEMTDRNAGPMPFLMQVDRAARRTVDGVLAGRSVVAYPRRAAWPLRSLGKVLPRPLWRPLVRALARDDG